MAKYRPFPIMEQTLKEVSNEALGRCLKSFLQTQVELGWPAYNPAQHTTIRKVFHDLTEYIVDEPESKVIRAYRVARKKENS